MENNNINLDFIKNIIESMKNDFFNNELFAYMAINGGYELPFQSNLGKKILDKLGEEYWVYTNKNKIDILIHNLNNNTNIAIEVGHYQLQQSFSGDSKLCSDIFDKKDKFNCPVFHIFLLSDITSDNKNKDTITKYGSSRKKTFEDYSEVYEKYNEKREILGDEFSYFGFKINYRIFITGSFFKDTVK